MLGLKQLCYPIIITSSLGLGINIVDSTSERYGYVPPCQHYSDGMNYYLNRRVSRKIGNDNLQQYDLYSGNNIFSRKMREHQIQSLVKREELINIYNQEQHGNRIREQSQSVKNLND